LIISDFKWNIFAVIFSLCNYLTNSKNVKKSELGVEIYLLTLFCIHFPSEMSHRSAHFAKIVNEAESDLRELL